LEAIVGAVVVVVGMMWRWEVNKHGYQDINNILLHERQEIGLIWFFVRRLIVQICQTW
jgi:hypothetical protein